MSYCAVTKGRKCPWSAFSFPSSPMGTRKTLYKRSKCTIRNIPQGLNLHFFS